jgi:hypothetical protein
MALRIGGTLAEGERHRGFEWVVSWASKATSGGRGVVDGG